MQQDQFWHLLAKKLSGEASPEEIQTLTGLIKSFPELCYSAEHVAELWTMELPCKTADAEKAFQKHMARLQQEHPNLPDPPCEELEPSVIPSEAPKRKWRKPVVVVVFLFSLALAAFMWNGTTPENTGTQSSQTEEIFTRPGTRTKLILPDSSVVWLNAGSKLTYSHPFGVNDRIVNLSGEAFFDVVKSAKPFIIHTSGVQIKVLGTAFNVRNYPDEKRIETSLIRGRVEVTMDKSPEKKYVLSPNEKLSLNKEPEITPREKKKENAPMAVISTVNYIDETTIAETSWVDNKLVFDDESFEEIAKKMERWYGSPIHFTDEKVKQERLTGVFEKETLWQALSSLQEIVPFHFTVKNGEVTIKN